MTDKHIPASKLLALPRLNRHLVEDDNGGLVSYDDIRALIDEAPEVERMTQTLIEELEALHSEYEDADCNAYYMANDLRAIIDEAPPIHDLTKLVEELVEALEDIGEWINTLPAGTKAATTKGKMIDALLTRAKEYLK